jgi:cytoskeletal protein RodZ
MDTVGQMLRRAREDQERSLEAIAGQTKIPVASLRLLEQDTFDELPGDIFVRGFLKSYCQALCIEDDEVLETYLKQTGSPNDVRSSSMPSLSGSRPISLRMSNLSWIVALALFLLLGAVLLIIIFYPGLRGGSDADRSVNSQETTGFVETTL